MRSSTNKTSSRYLTTGRKLALLAACSLFLAVCVSSLLYAANPKVYIKKLPNSNYQLIVDNRNFVVKGVCYNPIPIGYNHEYDWWSDPNKPWLVDGKLMKEMGVNTIRLYQGHEDANEVKQVIRDMYQRYGIRTMMGNWLGFWEYPCPFYGDKKFQDKVKNEVLEMVKLYKDEPGILGWVLGNENNFSCLGNVRKWTSEEIDKEPDPAKQNAMRAQIYYSFINGLAKEIHKIDPDHPVIMGNGELLGLDYANKFAPDIDIVGCVIYRGKTFGNIFSSLKATYDRPLLFIEFGSDAYDAYLERENQRQQAFFLESQWRQIYENLAGSGEGNCIGGSMFEWTDEWWKHNEDNSTGWRLQDTESNWSNGAYYFDIQAKNGKNMNEEWFGIVGLSPDLENGINKRFPRRAYYVVKEFWKKPNLGAKHKQKR